MWGRGALARAGSVAVVAGVAGGVVAACGQGAKPKAARAAPPAGAGFLAPPTPMHAERLASGAVRVSGHAPPDAIVRLLSPDGRATGVGADAAGAWAVELPADAQPRLFALTADLPTGRTLRAEGALALLPPGSAAPLLTARAGAASAPAPVSASLQAPLRLTSVDFDAAGGLAAAGIGRPGGALRLVVDGALVGAGQADASGRFALLAVRGPLAQGAHRVRVEGAGGAAEAGLDTAAPAQLEGQPYRVAHGAGGWRIDWSPPGGGVQSLFALDAPAQGAGAGPRA